MNFKQSTVPFLKITAFTLIAGLFTRLILMFMPITETSFTFGEVVKIFALGIVNDLCVAVIVSILMEINILLISDFKYSKPLGFIILGLILALLLYLVFFKTIFDEYGSAAPLVAKTLVGFVAVLFGCFLFFPKIRQSLRYTIFAVIFFIYIILLLFNAFSEYFFWNEFGVRYNFIAVDYLIYTHEVIGNIFESYPIIPMVMVLIVISLIITYLLIKNSRCYFEKGLSLKPKLLHLLIYAGSFFVSIFMLKSTEKLENSNNLFVNELQTNGLFKFFRAFQNQTLDYNVFYSQISVSESFSIIDSTYHTISKTIQSPLPEIRKNIVLITIESMSGKFMQYFGNQENITPNLDKLANEGIFFTQLFATGNRTVRGLEALTLCLPPLPGESLIKRKDNENPFSIGCILREKGYATQFLYGGFSYFDNMKDFYEGNDYQVIDRNSFEKNEITFANIWGVCDEDMFEKALKVFDENERNGKPFFAQILSVSNHRPFTYPDGKIDIPSNSKRRAGGVKYTDYAVGKFIEEAKKHSWFGNTVFVIIADHCASSQGSVSIPLAQYHIPCIIYSPQFIAHQRVEKVSSQIDIMPTLLGLLNFSYKTNFYGQDVLKPDYQPRALVATYQDLGFFKDNILTVLSPNKKITQFEVQMDTLYNYPMIKREKLNQSAVNETIANYQIGSSLIAVLHCSAQVGFD